MIARVCSVHGCPAIATDGSYCATHARSLESIRRRIHDDRRGSSTARGYDRRWRRVRASVLARRPLCEDCERDGRVTLAAEVHHVDGDTRHNTDDNLIPLCKSCHSRRTMIERGGAGRKSKKSFL